MYSSPQVCPETGAPDKTRLSAAGFRGAPCSPRRRRQPPRSRRPVGGRGSLPAPRPAALRGAAGVAQRPGDLARHAATPRQCGAARPPARAHLRAAHARGGLGDLQLAARRLDPGQRAPQAHPAAAPGGRRVRPRPRAAPRPAHRGAGRRSASPTCPDGTSTSSRGMPSRCPCSSSPSCWECPRPTVTTCGRGPRRS